LLEAMLTVPLIAADQRGEIWAAARDLGGKLAKKTADLELDEKQQRPSARPGDLERIALADADKVRGRFDRELALMRLAGVSANQIELVRRHADEVLPANVSAAIPAAVYAVGDDVQQTWTQNLPSQFSTEAKPGRRDRLAWGWPGWLRPAG